MMRIRLTFFKLFTDFSFNDQDGYDLYFFLDSIVTLYTLRSYTTKVARTLRHNRDILRPYRQNPKIRVDEDSMLGPMLVGNIKEGQIALF